MKITDLMIGDWVVYNGDVEYTNPIKIEGMDIATDMLITSDREDVSFNGIEPIPLTAEILERNGFEGTPTGDLFIEKKLWETYAIELFASEGSWIMRITDKTNWYIDGCNRINLYIKYIHKLQHALKLCGIDKNIEL